MEIETWVQWTTNRKWPIGIRMVTWLMTSRDPQRWRSWHQDIWGHYLDNGWRHGLGANGAPIRNDYLAIKWSRDRRRHLTLKGQGRASIYLSPKYLDIETWIQWTTNRKWPIGIRMVTWVMTLRDPERWRSWPQDIWGPWPRRRLEIRSWCQ